MLLKVITGVHPAESYHYFLQVSTNLYWNKSFRDCIIVSENAKEILFHCQFCILLKGKWKSEIDEMRVNTHDCYIWNILLKTDMCYLSVTRRVCVLLHYFWSLYIYYVHNNISFRVQMDNHCLCPFNIFTFFTSIQFSIKSHEY